MLEIGTNNIADISIGSTSVLKVYLGDVLVYSKDVRKTTWESISWTGQSSFDGEDIKELSNTIYSLNGTIATTYTLNPTTFTWTQASTGVGMSGASMFYNPYKNTLSWAIEQRKGGLFSTYSYYESRYNGETYTRNASDLATNIMSGMASMYKYQNYIGWDDGTTCYLTAAQPMYAKKYDNSNDNWTDGLQLTGGTQISILGQYVWKDNDGNIYYSNGNTHYVRNAGGTWDTQTWVGLDNFSGQDVWTDGTNIYYSTGTTHYMLDKDTSTWTLVTFDGLTSFNGRNVWQDTEGNVYYSSGSTHYKLV